MLKFKNPTFEETANKEWLVANGIGGYASATLNGSNSRRYHGLLVASLNPPTQRQVLVSKIEEAISCKRDTWLDFSTNQYPNTVYPNGAQYIKSFDRKPFPTWNIQQGNALIEKTIFMVYGSNTTVVEYKNIGKSTYELSLTPLLTNRDYPVSYTHLTLPTKA